MWSVIEEDAYNSTVTLAAFAHTFMHAHTHTHIYHMDIHTQTLRGDLVYQRALGPYTWSLSHCLTMTAFIGVHSTLVAL